MRARYKGQPLTIKKPQPFISHAIVISRVHVERGQKFSLSWNLSCLRAVSLASKMLLSCSCHAQQDALPFQAGRPAQPVTRMLSCWYSQGSHHRLPFSA